MAAVDTRVLVRLITRYDARQSDRAAPLFQRGEVWVAKTILLETDWVLRSLNRFTAEGVGVALTRLAGLPNVHLEDPLAAAQALAWLASGSILQMGCIWRAVARLCVLRALMKDS